jgi:hypothetical protein
MLPFSQFCSLASNPPTISASGGTLVKGVVNNNFCELNRKALAFDVALAMNGERAEVAGNMMAIGNNLNSYCQPNSLLPANFNPNSLVHSEIMGSSMITADMIKK